MQEKTIPDSHPLRDVYATLYGMYMPCNHTQTFPLGKWIHAVLCVGLKTQNPGAHAQGRFQLLLSLLLLLLFCLLPETVTQNTGPFPTSFTPALLSQSFLTIHRTVWGNGSRVNTQWFCDAVGA